MGSYMRRPWGDKKNTGQWLSGGRESVELFLYDGYGYYIDCMLIFLSLKSRYIVEMTGICLK